MKKLVTILTVLVAAMSLKAQQGEIIYRDFEPDSIIYVFHTGSGSMLIDLDGEGEADIRMYYTAGSDGVFLEIYSIYSDSLKICAVEQDKVLTEVEEEEWNNSIYFGVVHTHDNYGFRFKHNDGFLFGWFETFKESSGNWGFDRTAFCTIPNYPLRYGQTTLTTGFEEETIDNGFSVYPNPTKDILNVETCQGASLPEKTAYRITNLLGQTLLQGNITAETQQINIENLPAGMYFISFAGETQKFIIEQ